MCSKARPDPFELLLINPQHVRALPGRKTDAQDCEREQDHVALNILSDLNAGIETAFGDIDGVIGGRDLKIHFRVFRCEIREFRDEHQSDGYPRSDQTDPSSGTISQISGLIE